MGIQPRMLNAWFSGEKTQSRTQILGQDERFYSTSLNPEILISQRKHNSNQPISCGNASTTQDGTLEKNTLLD